MARRQIEIPHAGGVSLRLCWVIKGAVILITGDQPPVFYQRGGFLFPVTLIGVYLIAVCIVHLMIIGGVLESINERLLEVPLVLLGCALALLGVALLRHASSSESPSVSEKGLQLT